MLKIVAISDTHKAYWRLKLPEADILIHAGDMDIYRYAEEFNDFCKWMDGINIKHKIVIAGNHDGYIESYSHLVRSQPNLPFTYLQNNSTEIEGIKIYGSPITPKFGSWAFMSDGKRIQKYWDAIPDNTNILVTHGPPYGILDRTPDRVNFDHQVVKGGNVGCPYLLKRVKELKHLKAHIFGHIHYSRGEVKKYGIKFINTTVMDEKYELVYEPTIIYA